MLKDRDGKVITGTWSVSTDNKRLILENLNPVPTNTIGTIEYYIRPRPRRPAALQRTAESRKTGNTVNDYQLVRWSSTRSDLLLRIADAGPSVSNTQQLF
jgi:hypothetical protein